MPKFDNTNPARFEIPGVTFTSLAAPSRGVRETAMWRASVAPNQQGLVHHMTREEVILAVAGEGIVEIGDERHQLAPGDAFAVPPFTDFRLECAGDTPFEAIVVLPVGGHAVIAGQPAFQPPWSV